MRIGQSSGHRYCTNSGAPAPTPKISTNIRPMLPPFFTGGAKCPKFWPKFRPQSSSNRHIFELQRFIGKQKQTCQGRMTGLPSYHSWSGWVPPTPRTVGAFGTPRVHRGVTQKGKSGKFLIYPPFQWPTPSSPPPMLYHLLAP